MSPPMCYDDIVVNFSGLEKEVTVIATVDETSGPRIRAYLDKQRPPTCSEIAREAGVSRQYVWRILRGRELPSARVLAACERLGVPVRDVLSAREAPPRGRG
jgi:transcriptional regulator with XRE-family HTH domain